MTLGDTPVGPGALTSQATSAASPVLLRDDATPQVPVGGSLLMIVLFAVAVWAWTRGRRTRSSDFPRGGGFPWHIFGRQDDLRTSIRIRESIRLDSGARIHLVQWASQELLVAVHGTQPPVVLASRVIDPNLIPPGA